MSDWITRAELAGHLELSTRQISELSRGVNGRPGLPSMVKGHQRLYEWPACNRWYLAYKLAAVTPADTDGAKDDAQVRKLTAEAALKEMELAARQGQLLDADYVEQQLTGILERLRSRILGARGRYAPQLIGLKSVGDVQVRLERFTDELLEALTAVGDDPSLDPDDGADPAGAEDAGVARAA